MLRNGQIKISSFQIIIGSFLAIILTGALLLMLPLCSAAGTVTPFGDTLFTATSAVCVTGLVVRDTATHWSPLGQLLILILIQVGGLGTITLATMVTMLAGRKISLFQRSVLRDAVSADQLGGILHFTRFILMGTLAAELLGALFLFPAFLREFPLFQSILYSIFHSVSAFCNAGFDLMGTRQPYSSLTWYSGSVLINVTIMLLIIMGGVYVVEALSVMIQVSCFKLTGKRVFLMTPIHHHFEQMGWSETKIVIMFWLASALCVGIGLILFFTTMA